MKKETWLKIGSVLIYLFAPAFFWRLFFGFIEILFFIQINEIVIYMSVGISTFFTVFFGILAAIVMDEYILKQKTID